VLVRALVGWKRVKRAAGFKDPVLLDPKQPSAVRRGYGDPNLHRRSGGPRSSSMNKKQFIEALRDTAAALTPLTETVSPGAASWRGTEYVKATRHMRADPYALAWWSILCTMADLVEAQEAPLSVEQIKYIEKILFGGMGSLNDLYFDSKELGAIAEMVNKGLDEQRHDLYAVFKGLFLKGS
jgi:hypothetical protein